MKNHRQNFIGVTAAALALSACVGGGGGGGGGGSVSQPPAPAPPPPPPPPAPPPPHSISNIFPSITAPTDFAVIGVEADTIPATTVQTSGFSVRYDGTGYIFDLLSAEPASFTVNGEDAAYWNGYLSAGSSWVGYVGRVFKPSASNPEMALNYTSFLSYYDYDYDDYAPVGFLAFGTATPAAGIPLTGSATYSAIVKGITLDKWSEVGGTASLLFDFGSGTLAGTFNPVIYTNVGVLNPGAYNFVNTVFGIGSTTFSGQLQLTGAPSLGAFNGLFTGPAAQELMARWNAPYLNPESGQWAGMAGIWVGKKP